MFFCRPDADGVRFRVHLTPRSSKEAVGGLYGDALKIKVKAPPVDGKANEALLKLLSKKIGVPAAKISIASGLTGRTKTIRVEGLGPDEVKARLGLG